MREKLEELLKYIEGENSRGKNQIKNKCLELGLTGSCFFKGLEERNSWGKNQLKDLLLKCLIEKI